MAEGDVAPPKSGGFFKKDLAGIPVWGWLLIVIGGVGVGLYIIKNGNPLSSLTSSQAANTLASTTGNTTTGTTTTTGTNDTGNTSGQSSSGQGGFTLTTVNGQQVPIVPSGYKVLTDSYGNIVGYQSVGATSDNSGIIIAGGTAPHVSTNPSNNNPGLPQGTFIGPDGVLHYQANGQETLSQIASKYGLHSWNNIYAIPTNQRLFGALDAQHAAVYKPVAGQIITLPPELIPKNSGGGADRQYQSNIFGAY